MTVQPAASRIPTLSQDDFPLPAHPHRPGSGSAAEMLSLNRVKTLCPAVTDPQSWQGNLPYRYGWSLFDAGFYWEAHEVWEPVWLASRPNSPERTFLKAAIQMANGHLKRSMGKAKAAARLFAEVEVLSGELKSALRPRTDSYMGVELSIFDRMKEINENNAL